MGRIHPLIKTDTIDADARSDQRTTLACPAANVAGVHLKQLAQLGTAGPTGGAGFLRIGGVDHDTTPGTPAADFPSPVYSIWELNPVDSRPWTAATLPAEAGIVSS